MPLTLFQLFGPIDPELRPDNCKIHLAVNSGKREPLDRYLAGNFDQWQAWQNKRNFGRSHVIGLIQMPARHRWLFAGVYRVEGVEEMADGHFEYGLEPLPLFEPISGRAVIQFVRPGRQSYLLAENWEPQMTLAELRTERMQIAEFPGYSKAIVTKAELDIIVRQQLPSWRAALSNVAGVYVIADGATGKHYVGSATGADGIWSRWCAYSASGHGNNRDLIQLLAESPADYADGFQFGILEIADSHASHDDILARESHWKRLLLTRAHGLNAN